MNLPDPTAAQVRRLQFLARRAVATLLGGEYRSVFKGSGLIFEEVREYQPGDEVRTIDWNVTARVGQPFVKRFVEERERTVILLVDLSRSHDFGSAGTPKRQVLAEVASLIAFAAVANQDRVGLIGFTRQRETLVPPGRGARHVLRLLRDILYFQPRGRGTDLGRALGELMRVQRRRAVVFLLSDFLDRGYEAALAVAALKHDLIAVRVRDPLELAAPDLGIVRLEDRETGEQLLVDTRGPDLREAYRARQAAERERFARSMRERQADPVELLTDGTHIDALMRFFARRTRRGRR